MKRVILLLAVQAAAPACSDPSSSAGVADAAAEATACARADPSCTSPTPSYATTIHPVLTTYCVTCHYPRSTLAQSSLASYDDVHLVYGSALGQVSSCLMPPPGEPPLPAEQRDAVLAWLACGAPDN